MNSMYNHNIKLYLDKQANSADGEVLILRLALNTKFWGQGQPHLAKLKTRSETARNQPHINLSIIIVFSFFFKSFDFSKCSFKFNPINTTGVAKTQIKG